MPYPMKGLQYLVTYCYVKLSTIHREDESTGSNLYLHPPYEGGFRLIGKSITTLSVSLV